MKITVVTLVEEQMSSWKGNLPKLPIIIKYSAIGTRKYSGSKVEGDGEVRVMTRGFGDLVDKLGDKVVKEVLVRCWSDGDVGASCTLRKVSCVSFVFNILFVLSRGGSMSPDTFLPSILLLMAMLATSSSVAVILSATNFLMAAIVIVDAADVDVLLGAILSTFTKYE
ncbi:hypothetical protein Tco_0377179 [Tanacetum coccineum]